MRCPQDRGAKTRTRSATAAAFTTHDSPCHQELVDKGLPLRRRGVGTQDEQGRVARNVEFTSLHDDLARNGQAPQTRVLSAETRPADEMAAELVGVAVGSPTLFLRRLRLANGVPLGVLENTLQEQFTGIDTETFTRHGLYQVLRSKGVAMRVAKQSIGARQVTADEAGPLDMPERCADDEQHGLRQLGQSRRSRPALLPAGPLLFRDHARRPLIP
ncbi:MAG: GntR family transcriptional regulator, partial [Mycetocola sp.]|nr:GntR family transcriptional regulator [Mycetocola sp.]